MSVRQLMALGCLVVANSIGKGHAEFPAAKSFAGADEVLTFLNAGSAKLVYVNKAHSVKELHFIEFTSGGDALIKKIPAAQMPTAPVISPDGRWVTFASAQGSWGEAGTPTTATSTIWICKLEENATPVRVGEGCEPRFVQDTGRLTIVFPSVAPNYAWEGLGVTNKVDIDVSTDTAKPGTPDVFFQHGAYTGGLSKDGKYLCGGGGLGAMIDLEGGATRPDTIAPTPYARQACNVSISASSHFTNTLMYLDFGSTGDVPEGINGGDSWEAWQIIFVADKSKRLLRHYVIPRQFTYPVETTPASLDYLKWHHPEWSNHPHYAAATLNAVRYVKKPEGGYKNPEWQERIYFINLRTSDYLEVLRAGQLDSAALLAYDIFDGFFWPGLWVQPAQDFVEDSTWLQPQSAVNPRGAAGGNSGLIHFDGRRIAAREPIHSVGVHTLSGRTVGMLLPSGGNRRTVDLLDTWGRERLPKGTYFLRVEAEGGARRILRHTVGQ